MLVLKNVSLDILEGLWEWSSKGSSLRLIDVMNPYNKITGGAWFFIYITDLLFFLGTTAGSEI